MYVQYDILPVPLPDVRSLNYNGHNVCRIHVVRFIKDE